MKTNIHISKLIVITGLPGAGKSTVAEGLAQTLALPVFSVDPIEAAILNSTTIILRNLIFPQK